MSEDVKNTNDKEALKKSVTPLENEDLDAVVGGARRHIGQDISGNEAKED